MGSTMKSATLTGLVAIFIVCCDNKHLLIETEDGIDEEAGHDYSDYQGNGMHPEQLYGGKYVETSDANCNMKNTVSWNGGEKCMKSEVLAIDYKCRYKEFRKEDNFECYCCGKICDMEPAKICTRMCDHKNIRSSGLEAVIIMPFNWGAEPTCEIPK